MSTPFKFVQQTETMLGLEENAEVVWLKLCKIRLIDLLIVGICLTYAGRKGRAR